MALEQLGPLIEHHELFPDRTNVEFVQCIDAHTIKMRVWNAAPEKPLPAGQERWLLLSLRFSDGRCEAGEITVHLKGGDLRIAWDGTDGPAFMRARRLMFLNQDLRL